MKIEDIKKQIEVNNKIYKNYHTTWEERLKIKQENRLLYLQIYVLSKTQKASV